MKKIIRTIFYFSLALNATVFGLLGYAQMSIPDEINVSQSGNISSGAIFTYEIKNSSDTSQSENSSVKNEYELNISLFDAIPVKKTRVYMDKRKYVTVSGEVFGIKLYTDGVMVVAKEQIQTSDGSQISPGDIAGIREGDIIKKVNKKDIRSSAELSKIVASGSGDKIVLTVVRDGKTQNIEIQPVISSNDGKYKIGLWVRDSTAGIGTMTFFDRENGTFAGLGHAVCDVDTGFLMPISNGNAVEAIVKGCYKATVGTPGELIGVFDGGSIGKLCYNGETGVYGILDSVNKNYDLMPVAVSDEINKAAAKILCTVDENGPAYYDVEIERVYKSSSTVKNMVVRVTDEKLLGLTGGIVQGMSGTPIIQNGMLVGAITHVFVNDPTRGYAIFAENMVATAQQVYEDFAEKAS